MRKIILILVGVIVLVTIALFAVFVIFQPKPDVTMYEPLTSPKISVKEDQKMIEVRAKGDPNKSFQAAFGALFSVYYSLKDTPKGMKQPAPRLRMAEENVFAGGSKDKDWEFTIGLPVPDSVTSLPPSSGKSAYTVALATWEYGEVAEILHKGAYNKEPPTIKKLLDFIASQSYVTLGIHEEEYIIGPGMFFSKPEGYYTIIRYPVKKEVAGT